MKVKISHIETPQNKVLVELNSMEYIPYEDECITIGEQDYMVVSRDVETYINNTVCEQIVNINVLTWEEYDDRHKD